MRYSKIDEISFSIISAGDQRDLHLKININYTSHTIYRPVNIINTCTHSSDTTDVYNIEKRITTNYSRENIVSSKRVRYIIRIIQVYIRRGTYACIINNVIIDRTHTRIGGGGGGGIAFRKFVFHRRVT